MNASKDWSEIVAPDEEAQFTRLADRLATLQKMHAVDGHVARALHNKFHGGFEARLEVQGDLPEPARHGLFAEPKVYNALVRFSNGSGKAQEDDKGDVRGIGVKVLDVDGPKAIGDGRTQDFLGILQSSTPFRNAKEFVGLLWATRSPLLALPRLFSTFGLRTFPILSELKAVKDPVTSMAECRYFSALPFMCGPYAARFAWTPLAAPEPDGAITGPNRLAEDLKARLKQGPIEFALELQFFVDEASTPIEDGSVDWPEDVAPYVRVAKLVIPQQDAASERGKALAETIQNLSFDPWHALAEHRPLGGMMRARKFAYLTCGKGRNAQPDPEGDTV